MKKSSIFCILIASLIMMTGCKKDQDTVTLSAVINQPSKVFINSDRYPCWETNDPIFINNDTYVITSVNQYNRTVADIQDVVVSTNCYRAIYPANIVTASDISGNNPATVTLNKRQQYVGTSVDGNPYQKIKLPMGAYIASGKTLRFSNLCSVVRVNVDNTNGTDVRNIQEITITSANTLLSGTGTATVSTNDADNKITLSSGEKTVILSRSNPSDYMKTVNNGNANFFDIVVPEFGSETNPDVITITVKAAEGYKKIIVDNAYLNHSSVATINVDVATLNPNPAKLVTKIIFKYNETNIPTSGTVQLQTSDSPTPIYGYEGTDDNNDPCYIVATAADSILAHSDCRIMFGYMTTLQKIEFGSQFNTKLTQSMQEMFLSCEGLTTITLPSTFYTKRVTNMSGMFHGCKNITSITIPAEFNTENVTNMWSMFKDCKELTSINFPTTFNTSRVTTMQAMFDGCKKLTSLDLSTFNTARVTSMYAMFRNCKALTTLTLPSTFNTSSVNTMREMFNSCENLTTLTLPNAFTTANVTTMEAMFINCKKLTSLDLSLFNTANVVCMSEMFYNCQKMQTITLGTAFTMDAVVANCENYDSDGNLIGRYGRMFAYTGSQLGSNRKCTVYCTGDFRVFIEHDLDGTFHNQHPNIVQANAFWHNNAIRNSCTFVVLPTSK